MDITIYPRRLEGSLDIIPSKSQAHRLLICAAFADAPTQLLLSQTNRDIEATVQCLNALGARISKTGSGYEITPVKAVPATAELYCGESGSTLRFLLPVVGALGVDATFHMEGRLPHRPLSPLREELERMGCHITRPEQDLLRCQGKLQSGDYYMDGSISSQYITGLMFASALMGGKASIHITGMLESAPYVELTRQALSLFGFDSDNHQLKTPGTVNVEGDWSNGAFFLAANRLGSKVKINNLCASSAQGDRASAEILMDLYEKNNIDCRDIPDLVPILCIAAAAMHGAVFTGIRRLRLKESDRVATVCAMLQALGCHAEATEDTLRVYPGTITGGTVDACGDHRIAMSAAIAATVASSPVTILGAECVSKSYPGFFEEYKRLGGYYEQHIR